MKRAILLSVLGVCPSVFLFSQFIPAENPYQSSFNAAYQQSPAIPEGLLEAVSYTQTRISHLEPSMPASCTGMPASVGVMGLIENGKNYFNENLKLISGISGKTPELIKTDAHEEIMAYAYALQYYIGQYGLTSAPVEDKIIVLKELTEIPLHLNLEGNDYAFDAFLYSIVSFMNDPEMQDYYQFPHYKIEGEKVFGVEQWKFLSSDKIEMGNGKIRNEHQKDYQKNEHIFIQKSADYGPAIWNAAASCNYSSRGGTAISAVTIHTVQGSYSGCISWFQNCAASVSAHYVVRSSDGQITQMVLESNKAWHVGSENPYTVGIEHEGYVNNAAWYTTAMYTASAALSSDIATGYGINKIRTMWFPWSATTEYANDGIPGSCMKIKGHQHFPNQTHVDPGVNWDWNRYFKLIHPTPAATVMTTASGSFFDAGGSGANYSNDQRRIWRISPPGATSVTVTFSAFNLENTWDYLYIYNGADINAPLIGYYTGTTSPGVVSSTGGSLTFEFRSDCATTAAGWSASYTSSTGLTILNSTSAYVSDVADLTKSADDVNLGEATQQEYTSSLLVYPNPAEYFITLAGFRNAEGMYLVEWIDMQGKVWQSQRQPLNNHQAVLEVPAALANGMYILSVTGNQERYTIRTEVKR